MEPEIKETASESRFRRYANWSIVIGTGVGASYFFGFLVYHTLVPKPVAECGWFIQLIDKHFAATIGVPLSAITAFCIVLLLKVVNTGPVELEALGFKFHGAAGPVVLWIFCFLAVILGVYLLWNK
jgi:hypothetical protein